ncbi:MAG TPA: TetR/AcrR family transcriptional regulator [Pseudonocardiaceae bacterium]|jgi:AcrR family transcriptional regulator|nr:TetR/AcrR family transcriptional regulator [Pseudonocardiaceae bacterium]
MATPNTARRLPRAERREQILRAATAAFARSGFAATSLDDVAAEAGVTRMVVYTHFESKQALYQAVLDRMREMLNTATGAPDYDHFSIRAMLDVAAAEPAGFRLLFHHAAREPEFRAETDRMQGRGFDIAKQYLGPSIPDRKLADWACQLIPTVTIEAVIAWLDAGMPDPHGAADRIRRVIDGIVTAART